MLMQRTLFCSFLQPVHPKGDQFWVFNGRTDAKAETPILWPPHVKSWLIGKDSDAGRDGGQGEKGTTEDEMAGWHHWLDGRESEWTPGSWWWTGRPGVLRFMGSQRVGHDWATDLILLSYDGTSYPVYISLISLPLLPSHSGYKGLGFLAAKTMFIRARGSWNKRKREPRWKRESPSWPTAVFLYKWESNFKKLIRNGTSLPPILLNR